MTDSQSLYQLMMRIHEARGRAEKPTFGSLLRQVSQLHGEMERGNFELIRDEALNVACAAIRLAVEPVKGGAP